jgi:hypothetical protein
MYYDKQGNKIDINDWGRLLGNDSYRKVAFDSVGNVTVSTVWLGLDHNFYGEGEKLIFETLVFGGEDDGYMERYSTLEEAKKGHKRIVKNISNK